MEKIILLPYQLNSVCYVSMVLACFFANNNYMNTNVIHSVHAIETPQYTVVLSASDFEIRLYREASWISALVRGTSFEKSTHDGFHRVYQYIHGANLNSSALAMTAPVVTSILSSSSRSGIGEYDYFVRFYVSTNFEGNNPPKPNSNLKLRLDKWRAHCVAVRKFSGFAKDDNINNETQGLISSLNKHPAGKSAVIEYKSYSIAQYNASFHLTGRVNEVWKNVAGFTGGGCPTYNN